MSRLIAIGECMIEFSGDEERGYRLGFAGDTLNTAWYARAALDESHAVAWLSAVGDDHYSDRMLDFIGGAGIDVTPVRRIAGLRPGLYLIEQHDGDRRFTYWRDRSAARMLADDPAHLRAVLDGCDVVHLSGITLAILAPEARTRLLDAIGGSRATLAFDPNIRAALWSDDDTMREALTAAARRAHIVLPSFDDEALHFGDRDTDETIGRYRSLGCREIVVKNGPCPVDFRVEHVGGRVEVPPAKVVDATGAGDSFNGAYLAARLGGAGPDDAVRSAVACASLVVGHHGAIPRESGP